MALSSDAVGTPGDELELQHRDRRLRLYLPNRDTDHVQRGIAERERFYESDMLGHMEAVLRPGDLVVDAGAYIGSHTVYLAGGCDARVVAFEPNPESFAIMQRNVEINDLGDRVECHRAALGREAGRATVDEPPRDNLGSTTVTVDAEGDTEVLALDSVELPGTPRAIKIDVEGMEMDVLAGATQTIRTHRPLVYVEARNKAVLAGVMAMMRGWGYSATAQFNATPTVLMVPEQDVLDVLNAQLAFARHAMHTDLASQGERLKRQLAKQDEQAERLGAVAKTLSHVATSSRLAEVADRVERDGEAVHAAMTDQGRSIEALRAEVDRRVSSVTDQIGTLGEKLLKLYDRLVVVDDRVVEAASGSASTIEELSATHARGIEETRAAMEALRESVEQQGRRLGRIEAELFSLKQRALAAPPSSAARSVKAGNEGGRVEARRRGASKLGRVGRKSRKLFRDPDGFFEDARSPFVRSVVGRAYRSFRGRR